MRCLVDGVDHIYVPLRDADQAYDLLTTRLRLPPAWPFADHGGFCSGGVRLGNMNLEVVEANASIPSFVAGPFGAVRGVAFRPSSHIDDEYLKELAARGIAHRAPIKSPAWTNVALPGLLDDPATVFLCDYHDDFSQSPQQWQPTDADAGLGVTAVTELVITTSNDAVSQRWSPLLSPAAPDAQGRWRLPAGPCVRFDDSGDDGDAWVTSLTIAARSATTAEASWKEQTTGTALSDLPVAFTE